MFEPHFTYHGFRYVRVTGGTDWKKEDFTALAISTDNEVTGSFHCSDKRLNQLQSNICWSQRSNNISIPTDCPTREKAGWTGDVVVYGATALYNQNMTAFLRRLAEKHPHGAERKRPYSWHGPSDQGYVQQAYAGSLGWGDVILTLPLQLFHLWGDRSALSNNYEAMGRWMEAMVKEADEVSSPDLAGNENQHYLINTGFHFGDWIIPSVVNEEGFTDGPASAFLTMNYADTSLLAADADRYAEVSELLGYSENAEKYREYGRKVRRAFEESMYLPKDAWSGKCRGIIF